jgi:hypothetical protein
MRLFLTVVEQASFTRAAQAINLELAPVSEARVRHGIRVGCAAAGTEASRRAHDGGPRPPLARCHSGKLMPYRNQGKETTETSGSDCPLVPDCPWG